jgi:hypothetical protein
MHDTEKIPLRIHLALTPQRETVEPNDGSDMRKRWLTYCKPHAVKNPADSREILRFILAAKVFRPFSDLPTK